METEILENLGKVVKDYDTAGAGEDGGDPGHSQPKAISDRSRAGSGTYLERGSGLLQ
jgi:hypothetical protein